MTTDTRQLARETIDAGTLRAETLDAIRRSGEQGLTADEAAAVIGQTILAIRPRVTELNKAGLIVDSTHRRRNVSGRWATVWVLPAPKQKQKEFWG